MRHHGPVATTLASAVLGALSGFLAWVAMWLAAMGEFMRYAHAREEMAGAVGVGPSQGALFLLMVVGCTAGAFFGWRLTLRRRQHETAT